jgi:hypothetical protein
MTSDDGSQNLVDENNFYWWNPAYSDDEYGDHEPQRYARR